MARSPGGVGNAWLFRHGIPIAFDETNFVLGMVRDTPRTLIPTGGAYDIKDFLTDTQGRLYKRGGTTFASNAISEDILVGIAAPEYPGDPRLLVLGSTGSVRKVYDITSGTAGTGVTINRQPVENMTFWVDKLIVTEGYLASVIPKKVTLSGGVIAVADLAGGPPDTRYSCVHLGRLVLANSDAHPGRVYFSADGNPEDWTATNNFIETNSPVTGLASIQGTLLVFHRGSVQRVLGDTPPGYVIAGSRMQLEPVTGGVGCIDARSIVYSGDVVYFASESGIYSISGGGITGLTTKQDGSGISSLWRSFTSDLDPVLGAVVAQGIYSNDWLFTTIRHPSGVDIQFVCYLPTQSFMRTSTNIGCDMYVTRFAPHAVLYGANGNISEPVRALNLTSIFTPSSSNKNDADGTAVLPLLETRMLGEGATLKRYGDGFLTYDMRDAASDLPTMAISVATGIEADTGFTAVPESPLAAVSVAHRQRFTISKDANSVQLRFQQTNPSSKTEIYAVETSFVTYYSADGV